MVEVSGKKALWYYLVLEETLADSTPERMTLVVRPATWMDPKISHRFSIDSRTIHNEPSRTTGVIRLQKNLSKDQRSISEDKRFRKYLIRNINRPLPHLSPPSC